MSRLNHILNLIISDTQSDQVPDDIRQDVDYQELSQIWNLADTLRDEKSFNDQAWDELAGQIPLLEADDTVTQLAKQNSGARVVPMYRLRLGIAASVLALIGFGLHYLQPADPWTTYVALQDDALVVLPDESTIALSKGSAIRYLDGQQFDARERIVYLEGEGTFDIAKDEEHPFKVVTSGTTIDVLGTSFVYLAREAYSESENLSGLVNFSVNADPSQALQLNEGDKASYDGNELTFTPAPVPAPPPPPKDHVRVLDLIDILGDRYPERLMFSSSLAGSNAVVAIDLSQSLGEILVELRENEHVRIGFRSIANSNRYALSQLQADDVGLTANYDFDDYLMQRPYAAARK